MEPTEVGVGAQSHRVEPVLYVVFGLLVVDVQHGDGFASRVPECSATSRSLRREPQGEQRLPYLVWRVHGVIAGGRLHRLEQPVLLHAPGSASRSAWRGTG